MPSGSLARAATHTAHELALSWNAALDAAAQQLIDGGHRGITRVHEPDMTDVRGAGAGWWRAVGRCG